jgi:hypothetical protein
LQRKKEQDLINAIYKLTAKDGVLWDDVYIIGTCGYNQTIIDHEIAHAFYALDKLYKKTCDALLAKVKKGVKNGVKEYLLSSGYSKLFLKDEMQAYFSTSNLPFLTRPEFKDNLESYKNRWSENS